jgi:hypothetical protein
VKHPLKTKAISLRHDCHCFFHSVRNRLWWRGHITGGSVFISTKNKKKNQMAEVKSVSTGLPVTRANFSITKCMKTFNYENRRNWRTKKKCSDFLFYSVLLCCVLFYSILFCSILFYSILFCSGLFYIFYSIYSILFYSITFYLFYSILFHSTCILFCYVLFYPFYSIQFYSIIFYSFLFCSTLFCLPGCQFVPLSNRSLKSKH